MASLTEILLRNAFFTPFLRKIPAGGTLFKQGETGRTFFVILQGQVKLTSETASGVHGIAVIRPGELLGEKSLVNESGRLRLFTAEAVEEVVAAELGLKEIEDLQKHNPQLLIEFLKKSFEVSALRLDRANYLAGVLKGCETEKRFHHCILYLARTSGLKQSQGVLIPGLVSGLDYYIGMTPSERDQWLNQLEVRGLLKRIAMDDWVLSSEKDLLLYINQLESISQAA